MENTLADIDKAFKVEMMKMPPSLLDTKLGDLGGGLLTSLSFSVFCVSPFYPCVWKRGLLLRRGLHRPEGQSALEVLAPPNGGWGLTRLSLSRTSLRWCPSPSGGFPVGEVTQTRFHVLLTSDADTFRSRFSEIDGDARR